jgi:hypothetical protein
VPGVSPEGEDAARLWLEYGGSDGQSSLARSFLARISDQASDRTIIGTQSGRRFQAGNAACGRHFWVAGSCPRASECVAPGRVVTDFTLPAEHVIGPAHLVQLLAVPMEGPGRPRWRRPE